MFGAIKILAGDFKAGMGSTYALGKLYLRKNGSLFREKVPVVNIASLEIADSTSAGGTLFSDAGLAVGSLTSNNKEVAAVCVLRDGRKFLGMMGTADYNNLKQKVMSPTSFTKQQKKTWGCLVIVLSLGIAVFTCQDDTPWQERDSSIFAEGHIKRHARSLLVSPSTAKFPGAFDERPHVTRYENQVYEVYSYVDAQNSFGAVIRKKYYGKVRQTAEYEWEILNFYWLP